MYLETATDSEVRVLGSQHFSNYQPIIASQLQALKIGRGSDDVIDVFVLNVSQATWEIKIQIGCDDED